MIGSTIMPAIFGPCSANTRSAASASLKGTFSTVSTVPGIMPGVCGTAFGRSRGPASSLDGKTLTIRASWWPW